jgi:sec-independent protein translocase protein TatA
VNQLGLGNIGWSGLILILIALLLVFGPSKLPEIGKAFGKSLKEFKDATRGMMDDASKKDTAKDIVQASSEIHVEPIELKSDVPSPDGGVSHNK